MPSSSQTPAKWSAMSSMATRDENHDQELRGIKATCNNGILEFALPAEGLPKAGKVTIRVLPSGKSDNKVA